MFPYQARALLTEYIHMVLYILKFHDLTSALKNTPRCNCFSPVSCFCVDLVHESPPLRHSYMDRQFGRNNSAPGMAAPASAPPFYCVHRDFESVSDVAGFTHRLWTEELEESSWHSPGSLLPGLAHRTGEAIHARKRKPINSPTQL